MTTGEKIRKRRRELHLTQVEVSKMLGITQGTYAQYEGDKRNPKLQTLKRIAVALDTDVIDLLSEYTVNTRTEKKEKRDYLEDDDFGAICNCAVRYCLGRRSYMPKLVVDYITPLLPKLTEKTLACFQMDIETERKTGFDFGAGCDIETWDMFYKAVCDEVERRRKHEVD